MKIVRKLVKIFFVTLFKLGLVFRVIILPDHYYSPIANLRDLRKNKIWQKKSKLIGMKINLNKQIKNLKKIAIYKSDYETSDLHRQAIKNNAGLGFGEIEAQALEGFIKYYRPDKIIEIGSGVSTYIMINSGAKNITCIEPHPSKFILQNKKIKLIKEKLQNCNFKVFNQLKKGDLIFIDSSHALKLGGELTEIYLEIIPRLKPGVFIHIHDIAFPYQYLPNADRAMFQWLETQFLQALLVNNSKIEILFCLSHLHYEKSIELKKIFPKYRPLEHKNGLSTFNNVSHFPSSIYLITK